MKKLFTYLLALVATLSIGANAATYDDFLAAIKSAEFEYSPSSPNGVYYYLTMNDGHTLSIDYVYIEDEDGNAMNGEEDIDGNGTDVVTFFFSVAPDPEGDTFGLYLGYCYVYLDGEEVDWNHDEYLDFKRKTADGPDEPEEPVEEPDPVEDFRAAITEATYTVDEDNDSYTCTLVLDGNTSFELGDNDLLVSPTDGFTPTEVSVNGQTITILFEYGILPEDGEPVTLDLKVYKVNGNRLTGAGYIEVTFLPAPEVPTALTQTEAAQTTVKVLREGRLLLRRGDALYDVLGR